MPIPECFEGVLHLHDNATAMLNEYTNGESPVVGLQENNHAINAQTSNAQKANSQTNDVKNNKEGE